MPILLGPLWGFDEINYVEYVKDIEKYLSLILKILIIDGYQ